MKKRKRIMKKSILSKEVKAYIDFLHPDGSTFEVCAIRPDKKRSELWDSKPVSGNGIVAGWSNDSEKAATLVGKLNKVKPEGVYITLNRCNKSLLKRASNKLIANVHRTKDSEIKKITNILVDIDPIRTSGTSATDEEHDIAIETAKKISKDLNKDGWPTPLMVDSGNGAHLIIRTNLDNNEQNVRTINQLLSVLAKRYNTPQVKIDKSVSNPGRLVKLPGTKTRKGDNLPDRPHRMAKILYIPKFIKKVSADFLVEKMASALEEFSEHEKPLASKTTAYMDVEAYLKHYDIGLKRIKSWRGGKLYILNSCLFNSEHKPNKASIFQSSEGVLYYRCFHDSCREKRWNDARQIISGKDDLTLFFPLPSNVNTSDEIQYSIMSGTELIKQHVKEKLIIKGLLEHCGSLLIVGQTGIMKSMLTLNIALNLANPSEGSRLWDIFDIPRAVNTLFIQSENGIYGTKKRVQLMVSGNKRFSPALGKIFFPELHKDCRIAGNLNDKNFQKTLKEMIFKTQSRLMVVDPLISFHGQNENDNAEIRKVLDSLTALCDVTKVACILVHHSGKTSAEGTFAGRGASAIADWAANIINLSKGDDDNDNDNGSRKINVNHVKSRNFQACAPFTLEVDGKLQFTKAASLIDQDHKKVLDVLRSMDGEIEDQKSFMQALLNSGVSSESTAGRMIKKAAKAGIIQDFQNGKKKGYRLTNTKNELQN